MAQETKETKTMVKFEIYGTPTSAKILRNLPSVQQLNSNPTISAENYVLIEIFF